MGFLQQFHLVIKYKKDIQIKVVDMLSRPSVNASIVLQHSSLAHENNIKRYARDEDFKEVYETLIHGNKVKELDYHIHEKFLYHLGKLCIPWDERVHVIIEEHSSLTSVHFSVGKTIISYDDIVIGLGCKNLCPNM
jgi:hypothetical protein